MTFLFQTEDGEPVTTEQLEKIISYAVHQAVEKKCRFPITDEQAKETSHLYGMIADVGAGDMSKGVEEIRKNHSYISGVRAKSDKFSTYFFMVILAVFTTGMLKAVWEGIKSIARVNK